MLLAFPEVAAIDCNHCRSYVYENAKPKIFRGQPVKRPAGLFPPCCYPTGCPKGTWWKQKTLTPENQRAYEHWQECRAVGQFPDDPIVRRNARIIQSVHDMVDRSERRALQQTLVALTGAALNGKIRGT